MYFRRDIEGLLEAPILLEECLSNVVRSIEHCIEVKYSAVERWGLNGKLLSCLSEDLRSIAFLIVNKEMQIVKIL